MIYPGELPTHLSNLINSKDKDVLKVMKDKFESLDTEKLKKFIPVAINKNLRIENFLANQELTKRGIPPCFRALEGLNDKFNGSADSQIIDLDWIANRYTRNQKTAYGFYGQLFNQWSFYKIALTIWQNDQRPMWKIVGGLKLTTLQLWQCHYIANDKVRKKRKKLAEQLPEVTAELRNSRYARNLTLVTNKELDEFKRWIDVWQVAHIANWKPTETARLYTLQTGNPLSRQMASKILFKLERDAWKFK